MGFKVQGLAAESEAREVNTYVIVSSENAHKGRRLVKERYGPNPYINANVSQNFAEFFSPVRSEYLLGILIHVLRLKETINEVVIVTDKGHVQQAIRVVGKVRRQIQVFLEREVFVRLEVLSAPDVPYRAKTAVICCIDHRFEEDAASYALDAVQATGEGEVPFIVAKPGAILELIGHFGERVRHLAEGEIVDAIKKQPDIKTVFVYAHGEGCAAFAFYGMTDADFQKYLSVATRRLNRAFRKHGLDVQAVGLLQDSCSIRLAQEELVGVVV